MKASNDRTPPSSTHRIVTAALGALFIGLAVAILVVAEHTIGVMLAALVVGGIGLDALVNAWLKRRSLMERIGPLP